MKLALAVLSWRAHRTLRNTLDSYKTLGLDRLVDERIIFFQEISQRDRQIAEHYGYEAIGDAINVGIARAYTRLVEHSTSDLFLFLENDWLLLEDPELQINDAKLLLSYTLADVVRFRHRLEPGAPLWTLQYRGTELERPEFLLDSIHWTDPNRFPQITKMSIDDEKGKREYFVTTARYANWTNNPTMFRREWLIDNILPRIGSRDAEVDLQEWWREQDFVVVQGQGLFKHNRIG